MKTLKLTAILAAIAVLALSLVACGGNDSTSTDPTTTTPESGVELPVVEYISYGEFKALSEEDQEEYKYYLLGEYFKHLKVLHTQQTPLEMEYGLYHTVQFDRHNSTPSEELLLGVDDLGNFSASWLPQAGFGNAIIDEKGVATDHYEIVLRNSEYCIIYSALTGNLIQYHLLDGEEQLGYVPKGSLHVGNSDWGYLYFQSGEDVWVVKPNSFESPAKIASGVDYVVDTDYNLTPDAQFSEPLLMMMDGSLRAYNTNMPEGERLVDPRDYRPTF